MISLQNTGQKNKRFLIFIFRPEFLIFFLALFNFFWFYFHSRMFQEIGSTAIGFCAACSWYWNSINLPFLLLLAAFFLLFDKVISYLTAAIISGYLVVEGINWVSGVNGFFNGVSRRFESISNYDGSELWSFLDWQYLLALIITVMALGNIIAKIIKLSTNHHKPPAEIG